MSLPERSKVVAEAVSMAGASSSDLILSILQNMNALLSVTRLISV